MENFKHISAEQLRSELLPSQTVILDIRDGHSFSNGHLPKAQHLSNENLVDFINTTDKQKTLLIYCYHGNSSQQAAQYFVSQGFTEVYSLDGGFASWSSLFPDQIEK